jgi:hypothetical protein
VLAFASVYFSESRFFNGLQPKEVRKSTSFFQARAVIVVWKLSNSLRGLVALPGWAKRVDSAQENMYSDNFCFCQDDSLRLGGVRRRRSPQQDRDFRPGSRSSAAAADKMRCR